jgi:glycogen debranching enzyme
MGILLHGAVWLMCTVSAGEGLAGAPEAVLARQVHGDTRLGAVLSRARAVMETGFNAGDGYAEVWIRDLNTFIELACAVRNHDEVRGHLLRFLHFQGTDGNIPDGLTDATRAGGGYAYLRAASQPDWVAHKNTVETDQESSLVQAVCRYARITGDRGVFAEVVLGKTVAERLDAALDFLVAHRLDPAHGLIWGATTADWGDVQPGHPWGVVLDEHTRRAIDIYDNAMFLIALDALVAAEALESARAAHWAVFRQTLAAAARAHLWDAAGGKFIPHLYLEGSPFPANFDERPIYYHGGTAVAIEAGLLSREEVATALARMQANVRAAGAATIGLTMYPAYPEGLFQNPILSTPYTYQNGGDWTWFGARMVRQLIRHGMIAEACAALSPMLDRVLKNNGFYEWYTLDNQPRGSGTYRGSAGVLYAAISDLQAWAARAVPPSPHAAGTPPPAERSSP